MGETSYTVVKTATVNTGATLAVTSIPKHKALYISNTGASPTAVVTVKGMKPDGTATDSFVINVGTGTTFFVPFRIYEVTSLSGANIGLAFLM